MWRNTEPSNTWWARINESDRVYLEPPNDPTFRMRIIDGLLLEKNEQGVVVVSIIAHSDYLNQIKDCLKTSHKPELGELQVSGDKGDVTRTVLDIKVTPDKLSDLLIRLAEFETMGKFKMPQEQIDKMSEKFNNKPAQKPQSKSKS